MCHESCEPWTIRFMRLPLSMRRTSFFRPNWKGKSEELIGKHFRVKQSINEVNWYDRVPPTWLVSTENHLKRTPRWTTAGIILNSKGVVTCRGTHKSQLPYWFHETQGHQMSSMPGWSKDKRQDKGLWSQYILVNATKMGAIHKLSQIVN